MLLGLSGAGKSSSGNTILGSERFEFSCDFAAVTTECAAESVMVEGRRVTVIDTPGFSDEVLSSRELCEELMKVPLMASPGPHALIFVVKLDRLSEADCALLERLPKLFGSDASKYSMVLFTHGDKLKKKSVEDLMQSNSHVSKLVSLCANRYCVFDNEKRENKLQVRSLLDKIDEMVTANEGQYYTSDNMKTFERYIRTKDKSSSGQFVPVNPKSSHHDDEKPKKMRWFEEVLEAFLNFVEELIELIRSYAKGMRYHSF